MLQLKSKKIELFICISCGIVVIGFILIYNDPAALFRSLLTLNPWWLLGAVLCMVMFWLSETCALHVLLRRFYGKEPFMDSLSANMGGQYFSAITPFSTGGQPFQVYYLSKKGRDVGVTASALLIKFLIYQTALVLLSTVLLIVKWDFFKRTVPNFVWLVVVGYVVNLSVLVIMTVIGRFKGIADHICRLLIKIGAKLKIVKNKEETLAAAEENLAHFHDTFGKMFKNLPTVILCFIFSTLQLLFYFSVSYFVYRAFGLNEVGLVTIIGAQGFVMMVSSFVPIPGAGVGAEASFSLFFSSFYPEEGQLALAVILWRFISFYLTIIVGVFFAMRIGKAKKESRLRKLRKKAEEAEVVEGQETVEEIVAIDTTGDVNETGVTDGIGEVTGISDIDGAYETAAAESTGGGNAGDDFENRPV